MAGEGQGGVTVNAGPYSGVDYTTRENEGSTKLLSQMGLRRIADEDATNRALREAAAANLRPLAAENPVQAEDPYLPDGTENPNFNWGGAPQADRPSFAEAQDIEARKQALASQQANQEAAEQQAALQQQAAAQAQQWAQKIDKDSDDLAKVSDPQQLLADPRDKAPRRWLTNLMIAMNNGANIVAGGTGEGALQKQINHDLNLDQQRKEFALKAVIERAKQNGASAEALAEIQKKGGDRIEATRQALLKRFESDTMAALSAYPQHKQAAQMELAKIQQQNAQRMSNLILEHTGSTVGGKETTVTGAKGSGNGRPTPSTDVQNFSRMVSLGEIAARQQELMQDPEAIPTADMQREYEQNENILINRAEAEQEGGAPSVMWSNFLRALPDWVPGSIPTQAYPEDANPKQREFMDNDAILGHFRAQQLGGQTAVANPRTLHTLMAPAKAMGGEDRADAIRKSKLQSKEFQDQAKRVEEVSRVGEKEQKLKTRAASQKPGLDLAKAVAKLPDSLQKTIWKSLKSSDPKTRDAAVDYLQKVGAGQ